MSFNLKNRNFLTLLDFAPEEVRYLLDLARELKLARYSGTEQQRLKGKNIALIFEKTSTRTRCAFEVAAYDQGANVTCLGPTGIQIGIKESMKDTAGVLQGCTMVSSIAVLTRRQPKNWGDMVSRYEMG